MKLYETRQGYWQVESLEKPLASEDDMDCYCHTGIAFKTVMCLWTSSTSDMNTYSFHYSVFSDRT